MTTNAIQEPETNASATTCRSMTGYAAVRREFRGWTIRVSIKSVNHRFLDVKVRIPDSLESYEQRLRQAIAAKIHRGHIDLQIAIDPGETAPVRLNREVLKAYVAAAQKLAEEVNANAELDTVALLRLPGVIVDFASELPETDDSRNELINVLDGAIGETLSKLDEMRRIEGHHLQEELHARAATVTTKIAEIAELLTALRPAFARHLQTRLKVLLNGANIEPARLAQEAALLAERCDVSEELDRLRSHLQQFATLLQASGEHGKKLDFLLQEMHREANTMLSKTPGVQDEALAIAALAVDVKLQIEKLREQVQNIE